MGEGVEEWKSGTGEGKWKMQMKISSCHCIRLASVKDNRPRSRPDQTRADPTPTMSNQLFFLSLADIFSVYPAIFKEVSTQLRKTKQIYLPSDEEWQDKMYYMLLDIQRQVNEQNDENISLNNIDKREKPVFDPERITKIILSPATSPSGRRSRVLKYCHDTTVRVKLRTSSRWNLPTIANAAKLLRKPPLPVTFQNEHEMRLAYSLIYDVFRCA